MFKIKPLKPVTILPKKAYDGDAGFDVFNNEASMVIWPDEKRKIKLGFAIELPEGYVALIQEKSGMAFKNGFITIGNVIDATYRGECHAIVWNTGDRPITIELGTKVAQMLIMPCYTGSAYLVVDELSESTRGEDGFGSTGLEAK
jgi:dUTP pyrophosphatase